MVGGEGKDGSACGGGMQHTQQRSSCYFVGLHFFLFKFDFFHVGLF